MDELIEIVAASFVRHGIECPAADSTSVGQATPVAAIPNATSPIEPAALPEHSYRKKPDAGLAT
ncbi:MAG: hypothetical protein WBV46_01325 [Terriglobales bacterium]|jgi:hypothetical protein